MKGLTQLLVVCLAFFAVCLAELTYLSNLYFAACAMAFGLVVIAAVIFGVLVKSRLLMLYGAICFVGAVLNTLMFASSMGMGAGGWLEYAYWDAPINYCLLIELTEYCIIINGGIDVIYRFLLMRSHAGNGGYHFDARVGLH